MNLSRPLSSVSSSEQIHGRFRRYSFVHENSEESLFDEDDDLKTRYLEKEQALKKINDDLERKTSEIFQKIEKYRFNESPRAHHVEIGQGDCPSNVPIKEISHPENEDDQNDPTFAYLKTRRMLRPYSSRSYLNYTRTCTDSNDNNCQPPFPQSNDSFSMGSNLKRPVTANPALALDSSTAMAHTEASLRRVETAKPLEGIEEKHQVRLQKATESVLKCVQSKLVNYEQRLTDMHLQYRQKIQENTMLEAKIKAIEEDRRRLLKTIQTLQATTDKFSKSVENTKINLNLKVQAFASLKKEMDGLKKEIKQKSCLIQSLQTRLDRCTEENRRLKSQHQSTQLSLKHQHNEDRCSMDELKQRIHQLENQKMTFQATVEKQAQLIRTLRSQKVSESQSET